MLQEKISYLLYFHIDIFLTSLHYYADAFIFFERLKKSGFSPDLISVGSLLHACEVNGDIKVQYME